jgi:hypothetical protein
MTKRLALAAATLLAFGVAGCGSNNPTNPSNITVFTVPLSALNENPPVTDAEGTARGTAVITINSDAHTVDFNVSLNGFTETSVVTAAHIHGPNGPAGVNAGILVNTGIGSGTVTLTRGAGTFSVPGVPTSADIIAQILANPQNFYFNVHTSLHGGGVIRGQLR